MKLKYKNILSKVNTIAIIGISSNPSRDSYKVMKYLINNGFNVFPVNPIEANKTILGKKCYKNLTDISEKIDMVDIFRRKEFVIKITKDAIRKKIKVIWTQLGIRCNKSAKLAEDAGLIFVMDKCPKIELEKIN